MPKKKTRIKSKEEIIGKEAKKKSEQEARIKSKEKARIKSEEKAEKKRRNILDETWSMLEADITLTNKEILAFLKYKNSARIRSLISQNRKTLFSILGDDKNIVLGYIRQLVKKYGAERVPVSTLKDSIDDTAKNIDEDDQDAILLELVRDGIIELELRDDDNNYGSIPVGDHAQNQPIAIDPACFIRLKPDLVENSSGQEGLSTMPENPDAALKPSQTAMAESRTIFSASASKKENISSDYKKSDKSAEASATTVPEPDTEQSFDSQLSKIEKKNGQLEASPAISGIEKPSKGDEKESEALNSKRRTSDKKTASKADSPKSSKPAETLTNLIDPDYSDSDIATKYIFKGSKLSVSKVENDVLSSNVNKVLLDPFKEFCKREKWTYKKGLHIALLLFLHYIPEHLRSADYTK